LFRQGPLPEPIARAYFIQLVTAVLHFHIQTNCCHRDLKPWNICLTKDLVAVKIIDFGLATPFKRGQIGFPFSGFVSGTPQFMAPELFSNGDDLSKVDTYALGVVLTNMLFGARIF
jgi:serine/threonine-protein kinase